MVNANSLFRSAGFLRAVVCTRVLGGRFFSITTRIAALAIFAAMATISVSTISAQAQSITLDPIGAQTIPAGLGNTRQFTVQLRNVPASVTYLNNPTDVDSVRLFIRMNQNASGVDEGQGGANHGFTGRSLLGVTSGVCDDASRADRPRPICGVDASQFTLNHNALDSPGVDFNNTDEDVYRLLVNRSGSNFDVTFTLTAKAAAANNQSFRMDLFRATYHNETVGLATSVGTFLNGADSTRTVNYSVGTGTAATVGSLASIDLGAVSATSLAETGGATARTGTGTISLPSGVNSGLLTITPDNPNDIVRQVRGTGTLTGAASLDARTTVRGPRADITLENISDGDTLRVTIRPVGVTANTGNRVYTITFNVEAAAPDPTAVLTATSGTEVDFDGVAGTTFTIVMSDIDRSALSAPVRLQIDLDDAGGTADIGGAGVLSFIAASDPQITAEDFTLAYDVALADVAIGSSAFSTSDKTVTIGLREAYFDSPAATKTITFTLKAVTANATAGDTIIPRIESVRSGGNDVVASTDIDNNGNSEDVDTVFTIGDATGAVPTITGNAVTYTGPAPNGVISLILNYAADISGRVTSNPAVTHFVYVGSSGITNSVDSGPVDCAQEAIAANLEIPIGTLNGSCSRELADGPGGEGLTGMGADGATITFRLRNAPGAGGLSEEATLTFAAATASASTATFAAFTAATGGTGIPASGTPSAIPVTEGVPIFQRLTLDGTLGDGEQVDLTPDDPVAAALSNADPDATIADDLTSRRGIYFIQTGGSASAISVEAETDDIVEGPEYFQIGGGDLLYTHGLLTPIPADGLLTYRIEDATRTNATVTLSGTTVAEGGTLTATVTLDGDKMLAEAATFRLMRVDATGGGVDQAQDADVSFGMVTVPANQLGASGTGTVTITAGDGSVGTEATGESFKVGVNLATSTYGDDRSLSAQIDSVASADVAITDVPPEVVTSTDLLSLTVNTLNPSTGGRDLITTFDPAVTAYGATLTGTTTARIVAIPAANAPNADITITAVALEGGSITVPTCATEDGATNTCEITGIGPGETALATIRVQAGNDVTVENYTIAIGPAYARLVVGTGNAVGGTATIVQGVTDPDAFTIRLRNYNGTPTTGFTNIRIDSSGTALGISPFLPEFAATGNPLRVLTSDNFVITIAEADNRGPGTADNSNRSHFLNEGSDRDNNFRVLIPGALMAANAGNNNNVNSEDVVFSVMAKSGAADAVTEFTFGRTGSAYVSGRAVSSGALAAPSGEGRDLPLGNALPNDGPNGTPVSIDVNLAPVVAETLTVGNITNNARIVEGESTEANFPAIPLTLTLNSTPTQNVLIRYQGATPAADNIYAALSTAASGDFAVATADSNVNHIATDVDADGVGGVDLYSGTFEVTPAAFNGGTTVTFNVTVSANADDIVEGPETASITLFPPTGITAPSSASVVTIEDEDDDTATSIDITAVVTRTTVVEGATDVRAWVTLEKAFATDIIVPLRLISVTGATIGTDVTPASGNITVEAGETDSRSGNSSSLTLTVPVNVDTAIETFRVEPIAPPYNGQHHSRRTAYELVDNLVSSEDITISLGTDATLSTLTVGGVPVTSLSSSPAVTLTAAGDHEVVATPTRGDASTVTWAIGGDTPAALTPTRTPPTATFTGTAANLANGDILNIVSTSEDGNETETYAVAVTVDTGESTAAPTFSDPAYTFTGPARNGVIQLVLDYTADIDISGRVTSNPAVTHFVYVSSTGLGGTPVDCEGGTNYAPGAVIPIDTLRRDCRDESPGEGFIASGPPGAEITFRLRNSEGDSADATLTFAASPATVTSATFAAWDAETGGSEVAATLSPAAIPVREGATVYARLMLNTALGAGETVTATPDDPEAAALANADPDATIANDNTTDLDTITSSIHAINPTEDADFDPVTASTDSIVEGPEYFQIDVGTVTYSHGDLNSNLTPADGILTFRIDDATTTNATVTLGGATTVAEGGTLTATVTLDADKMLAEAATFVLERVDASSGTQAQNADVSFGMVTVPANQLGASGEATVTITANDGSVGTEATGESFKVGVNLAASTYGGNRSLSGQITSAPSPDVAITDVADATVTITAASPTVNETAGEVEITVRLSAPATQTITLPITIGGTATTLISGDGDDSDGTGLFSPNNADYALISASECSGADDRNLNYCITGDDLVFNANDQEKTLTLRAIADGSAGEDTDETVIITLDAVTSGGITVPANTSATVTIVSPDFDLINPTNRRLEIGGASGSVTLRIRDFEFPATSASTDILVVPVSLNQLATPDGRVPPPNFPRTNNNARPMNADQGQEISGDFIRLSLPNPDGLTGDNRPYFLAQNTSAVRLVVPQVLLTTAAGTDSAPNAENIIININAIDNENAETGDFDWTMGIAGGAYPDVSQGRVSFNARRSGSFGALIPNDDTRIEYSIVRPLAAPPLPRTLNPAAQNILEVQGTRTDANFGGVVTVALPAVTAPLNAVSGEVVLDVTDTTAAPAAVSALSLTGNTQITITPASGVGVFNLIAPAESGRNTRFDVPGGGVDDLSLSFSATPERTIYGTVAFRVLPRLALTDNDSLTFEATGIIFRNSAGNVINAAGTEEAGFQIVVDDGIALRRTATVTSISLAPNSVLGGLKVGEGIVLDGEPVEPVLFDGITLRSDQTGSDADTNFLSESGDPAAGTGVGVGVAKIPFAAVGAAVAVEIEPGDPADFTTVGGTNAEGTANSLTPVPATTIAGDRTVMVSGFTPGRNTLTIRVAEASDANPRDYTISVIVAPAPPRSDDSTLASATVNNVPVVFPAGTVDIPAVTEATIVGMPTSPNATAFVCATATGAFITAPTAVSTGNGNTFIIYVVADEETDGTAVPAPNTCAEAATDVSEGNATATTITVNVLTVVANASDLTALSVTPGSGSEAPVDDFAVNTLHYGVTLADTITTAAITATARVATATVAVTVAASGDDGGTTIARTEVTNGDCSGTGSIGAGCGIAGVDEGDTAIVTITVTNTTQVKTYTIAIGPASARLVLSAATIAPVDDTGTVALENVVNLTLQLRNYAGIPAGGFANTQILAANTAGVPTGISGIGRGVTTITATDFTLSVAAVTGIDVGDGGFDNTTGGFRVVVPKALLDAGNNGSTGLVNGVDVPVVITANENARVGATTFTLNEVRSRNSSNGNAGNLLADTDTTVHTLTVDADTVATLSFSGAALGTEGAILAASGEEVTAQVSIKNPLAAADPNFTRVGFRVRTGTTDLPVDDGAATFLTTRSVTTARISYGNVLTIDHDLLETPAGTISSGSNGLSGWVISANTVATPLVINLRITLGADANTDGVFYTLELWEETNGNIDTFINPRDSGTLANRGRIEVGTFEPTITAGTIVPAMEGGGRTASLPVTVSLAAIPGDTRIYYRLTLPAADNAHALRDTDYTINCVRTSSPNPETCFDHRAKNTSGGGSLEFDADRDGSIADEAADSTGRFEIKSEGFAGTLSQTIMITIDASTDTFVEGPETVELTLFYPYDRDGDLDIDSADNPPLMLADVAVPITDANTSAVTVSLPATVQEGTSAAVTVSLDAGVTLAADATFTLELEDLATARNPAGTALAADFGEPAGTLPTVTIDAGMREGTADLVVIADAVDELTAGPEYFQLGIDEDADADPPINGVDGGARNLSAQLLVASYASSGDIRISTDSSGPSDDNTLVAATGLRLGATAAAALAPTGFQAGPIPPATGTAAAGGRVELLADVGSVVVVADPNDAFGEITSITGFRAATCTADPTVLQVDDPDGNIGSDGATVTATVGGTFGAANALRTGENCIRILVTAVNSDTQIYDVVVNVAMSDDAGLAATAPLTLDPTTRDTALVNVGTITYDPDAFTTGDVTASIRLPAGTTAGDLVINARDADALIGGFSLSGGIMGTLAVTDTRATASLTDIVNGGTIIFTVTAEDRANTGPGTIITYTINVVVQDALLTSAVFSPTAPISNAGVSTSAFTQTTDSSVNCVAPVALVACSGRISGAGILAGTTAGDLVLTLADPDDTITIDAATTTNERGTRLTVTDVSNTNGVRTVTLENLGIGTSTVTAVVRPADAGDATTDRTYTISLIVTPNSAARVAGITAVGPTTLPTATSSQTHTRNTRINFFARDFNVNPTTSAVTGIRFNLMFTGSGSDDPATGFTETFIGSGVLTNNYYMVTFNRSRHNLVLTGSGGEILVGVVDPAFASDGSIDVPIDIALRAETEDTDGVVGPLGGDAITGGTVSLEGNIDTVRNAGDDIIGARVYLATDSPNRQIEYTVVSGPTPVFTPETVTVDVNESSDGSGNPLIFTVGTTGTGVASVPDGETVTVTYTVTGDATHAYDAGTADYALSINGTVVTPVSGDNTLVMPASSNGVTTANFIVNPATDGNDELDEDVIITVNAVRFNSLDDLEGLSVTGTATIIDADEATAVLSALTPSATIAERNETSASTTLSIGNTDTSGYTDVTFTLAGAAIDTDYELEVQHSGTDDVKDNTSADGVAGNDLDPADGENSFRLPANVSSATFTFKALADNDATVDEEVILTITTVNPENGPSRTFTTATTVTITDFGDVPTARLDAVNAVEDGTDGEFILTLANAPNLDATVTYRINNVNELQYTATLDPGGFTGNIDDDITTGDNMLTIPATNIGPDGSAVARVNIDVVAVTADVDVVLTVSSITFAGDTGTGTDIAGADIMDSSGTADDGIVTLTLVNAGAAVATLERLSRTLSITNTGTIPFFNVTFTNLQPGTTSAFVCWQFGGNVSLPADEGEYASGDGDNFSHSLATGTGATDATLDRNNNCDPGGTINVTYATGTTSALVTLSVLELQVGNPNVVSGNAFNMELRAGTGSSANFVNPSLDDRTVTLVSMPTATLTGIGNAAEGDTVVGADRTLEVVWGTVDSTDLANSAVVNFSIVGGNGASTSDYTVDVVDDANISAESINTGTLNGTGRFTFAAGAGSRQAVIKVVAVEEAVIDPSGTVTLAITSVVFGGDMSLATHLDGVGGDTFDSSEVILGNNDAGASISVPTAATIRETVSTTSPAIPTSSDFNVVIISPPSANLETTIMLTLGSGPLYGAAHPNDYEISTTDTNVSLSGVANGANGGTLMAVIAMGNIVANTNYIIPFTVTATNDTVAGESNETISITLASVADTGSTNTFRPQAPTRRTITLVDNDIAVGGFCDRSARVVDAILMMIPGKACPHNLNGAVTEAELMGIGTLDVRGITATDDNRLKAGDFAGLSGLTDLMLAGAQGADLPDGVFMGLSALEMLDMGDLTYTGLADDVLDPVLPTLAAGGLTLPTVGNTLPAELSFMSVTTSNAPVGGTTSLTIEMLDESVPADIRVAVAIAGAQAAHVSLSGARVDTNDANNAADTDIATYGFTIPAGDTSVAFTVAVADAAAIGMATLTLGDITILAQGAGALAVGDLVALSGGVADVHTVTLTLPAASISLTPSAVEIGEKRRDERIITLTLNGVFAAHGTATVTFDISDPAGDETAVPPIPKLSTTAPEPTPDDGDYTLEVSERITSNGTVLMRENNTFDINMGRNPSATFTFTAIDDDRREGSETTTITVTDVMFATGAAANITGATVVATVEITELDPMDVMREVEMIAQVAGKEQVNLVTGLIRQRVSSLSLGAPTPRIPGASGVQLSLSENPETMEDFFSQMALESSSDMDDGGSYSVWAKGQYISVSGSPDVTGLTNFEYDGTIFGGGAGIERRRKETLFGMSINHTIADIDSESATRGKSGYKEDLTFFVPYAAYKPGNSRLTLWGTAGFGTGTAKITSTRHTPGSPSVQVLFAQGGMDISDKLGETVDIVLGMSAVAVEKTVDSYRVSIGLVPETESSLFQGQADFTAYFPVYSADGEVLRPYIGIASVHDAGDVQGDDRHAMELQTGIAWSNGPMQISADTFYQFLREDEEAWGLFGEVSYAGVGVMDGLLMGMTGGHGTASSMSDAATSTDSVNSDIDTTLTDADSDVAAWRFETNTGYGFAAPIVDRNGRATPFFRTTHSADARSFASGVRVDVTDEVGLTLESSRHVPSDDEAYSEHAVGLEARWAF